MKQEEFALAEIIVKLGIAFANCDGEFVRQEFDYINRYVTRLENEYGLDNKGKAKLITYCAIQHKIKDVAIDFNGLTLSLPANEKTVIKACIDDFIKGVIASDGKIAPEETDLYNEWNRLINI